MKDRLSALWPPASWQFQRSKLFFVLLVLLGPAAFSGFFFAELSPTKQLSELVDSLKPLNPLLSIPAEPHELIAATKPSNRSRKQASNENQASQARGSSRHRVRVGRYAATIPSNPSEESQENESRGMKGAVSSFGAETLRQDGIHHDLARLWNVSTSEGRWSRCPDRVAEAIPRAFGKAGFLKVICNGGLNQKRAAIADAVAVAWIMNRTLVVPTLETDRYWGDESGFSSLFNETRFIERLAGLVPVVRESDLPENLTASARVAQTRGKLAYFEYLAQRTMGDQLLILEKFSHKLSYKDAHVSREVQRLRCFANLEALRFTSSIEAAGRAVIGRLRGRGTAYVAVHLRFEQDMLAHAKCDFEGAPEERRELEEMRETYWPYRNQRDNDTIEGNKQAGRCPLTPEEVGRTLELLGFPPSTTVYIASGPVYKAEKSMPGLANLFPNLVRLTSPRNPGVPQLNISGLLNSEEMERFGSHADQLAALDYFVCAHADVFMPSFTGNMDFLLEGERRYAGFRTTIVPNRPRLAGILAERGLGFGAVQKRVFEVHPPVQRLGLEPRLDNLGAVLRHRHSVFSHPLPECMCLDGEMLPEEAYLTALADQS